jgi:hypothetical protein
MQVVREQAATVSLTPTAVSELRNIGTVERPPHKRGGSAINASYLIVNGFVEGVKQFPRQPGNPRGRTQFVVDSVTDPANRRRVNSHPAVKVIQSYRTGRFDEVASGVWTILTTTP